MLSPGQKKQKGRKKLYTNPIHEINRDNRSFLFICINYIVRELIHD
jgi:hypothetical protein